MKEKTLGVVAQLKNEGFNKGKLEAIDEIRESALEFLLKSHSIEEITEFLGMPYDEAFNRLLD